MGWFGTHCGEVAEGEDAEETRLSAGSIADDYQLSGTPRQHSTPGMCPDPDAGHPDQWSSFVPTQASRHQPQAEEVRGQDGAYLRMTLLGVAFAIVTTRYLRRRSAKRRLWAWSSFSSPRPFGGRSGVGIFAEIKIVSVQARLPLCGNGGGSAGGGGEAGSREGGEVEWDSPSVAISELSIRREF